MFTEQKPPTICLVDRHIPAQGVLAKPEGSSGRLCLIVRHIATLVCLVPTDFVGRVTRLCREVQRLGASISAPLDGAMRAGEEIDRQ